MEGRREKEKGRKEGKKEGRKRKQKNVREREIKGEGVVGLIWGGTGGYDPFILLGGASRI